MAAIKLCTFWIVVLLGVSFGNHVSRTRQSSIGQLGNPVLSVDPFAYRSSGSMSVSSGASSTGSSATSGSSGRSRSISSSSSIAEQPRSLVSRLIAAARRSGDPIIARVESRPMLIVRTGGGARPATRGHNLQAVSRQTSHGNDLLDLLGISPVIQGVHADHGVPSSHSAIPSNVGPVHLQHHGVPFVMDHPPVRSAPVVYPQPVPIMPSHVVTNPISSSQVNYPVYVPPPPPPQVQTVPNTPSGALPGSNNLKVDGINAKGEVVISGPGGSIIIGPELLNGISTNTGFPLMTEFEEFEQEATPGSGQPNNNNRNSITLTEPGRGSIILERALQSGTGTSVNNGGSTIQVLQGGGSVSGTNAVASSSASSSSSSTGSNSGAASFSSASAGTPVISIGNGVSVEQGQSGQIITLGNNGGQKQVISMGSGAPGEIQVAGGGTGIKVPGNATFIVNG